MGNPGGGFVHFTTGLANITTVITGVAALVGAIWGIFYSETVKVGVKNIYAYQAGVQYEKGFQYILKGNLEAAYFAFLEADELSPPFKSASALAKLVWGIDNALAMKDFDKKAAVADVILRERLIPPSSVYLKALREQTSQSVTPPPKRETPPVVPPARPDTAPQPQITPPPARPHFTPPPSPSSRPPRVE